MIMISVPEVVVSSSVLATAIPANKKVSEPLKRTAKKATRLLKKKIVVNGRIASVLDGFTPGKYDVLCNRSRRAFQHVGNRRFRVIVENHAAAFANLRMKAERSLMIQSILRIIENAGGRFVEKNDEGKWGEVGLTKRKEKIGHALRAAIAAMKAGSKPRTIYDVLGMDESSPFDANIANMNHDVEEGILQGLDDDLFESLSSCDNDKFKIEDTRENTSDEKVCILPPTDVSKTVEVESSCPISLADALISNVGARESTEEQHEVDKDLISPPVPVASIHASLHDSSTDDNGDVDAVFEMFKDEGKVIQGGELHELVGSLDAFFEKSSIFVCY
jgi:hypothetical protein